MEQVRRILIFPCGNTLSHVAQALAIAERLEADGVECHLGLAAARVRWASHFFSRCHAISELWETSGTPYPTLRWFSDRDHVERCLGSQEELVRRLHPDAVIGIFDFFSVVSGRGRPVISINGACMLPAYPGVLGFAEAESPQRREQQQTLDRFWEFAARAFAPALQRRGLPVPTHANELLLADHNLIYELQELSGLRERPANCRCVGPIFWSGWERLGKAPAWNTRNGEPTVYINVGTLAAQPVALHRLMDAVMEMGGRVGASTGPAGGSQSGARRWCRPGLSPTRATSLADVVVSTGGIGVCYQNLRCRVPSLVVPLHPEQATNGLHFEQGGCGRVLLPEIVFTGQSRQYADAVDPEWFRVTLREMLEQRLEFAPNLNRLGAVLESHDALAAISGLVRDLA